MAETPQVDTPVVDTPPAAPPAETPATVPPVQPTDTPTDTPPVDPEGGTELERAQAVAATAQKEAAQFKKDLKAANRALKIAQHGGNTATPPTDDPDAQPPVVEDNALQLNQAALAVTNAVAYSPEYQALLAEDPTLREIFQRNPLFYVKDFIDSEDAVDQVKEVLDARLEAKNSTTPPVPPVTAPPTDTPPVDPNAPQDPATPVIPQVGMTITPEMAAAIPLAEYGKLSDDVRTRLRRGETVNL